VELKRRGTDWMYIVSEWSEKMGVSVSGSKTVTMLLKGNIGSKVGR